MASSQFGRNYIGYFMVWLIEKVLVKGNMSLFSVIIIVLALLIIVALVILYKTRKRLKEMEGFRAIQEPGKNHDDGIIDSFGE